MTSRNIRICFLLGIVFLSGCESPHFSPSALQLDNSASTTPKLDSGWYIQQPEVNPIDGAKTQILYAGSLGSRLVLCFENGKLCSGNQAGVFITSPCVVDSDRDNDSTAYERSVRLRFDAERPQRETWGISDDRKGIFPHSPKTFIAELYKHKQVMVEFGCDTGDNDVLTYDIHNLQAAIESAGLQQ